MTRHPRTLVISAAAINDKSGTGVTLGNLFRGWPHEELAQVYSSLDSPDSTICPNSWRLDHNNVPMDRLLRRFVEGSLRLLRPDNPTQHMKAPPGVGSRRTRRARLSAWMDLAAIRVPAGLWSWAKNFRPEIIVSSLGSIRQIKLTSDMAEKLGVPVVPFFHDDWPSTMYQGDPVLRVPHSVLCAELARCLRLAPVGLANSDAMAQEFTGRFNLRFHAFMNAVEVGEYSPCAGLDDEVKFTYVGGLHLDRWRALDDLALAIGAACDMGLNARLVVYSPEADIPLIPNRMLESHRVTIGGSVSGGAVSAVLRDASVLVHVESFDGAIRDYTRLSFSTKLPLYMSLGRPVLAYGPPDGASVRYVGDNGLGVVVTERKHESLLAAVIRLCSDTGLREQLGLAGWRIARERYAADRMRDRFQRLLYSAVEQEQGDSARLGQPLKI